MYNSIYFMKYYKYYIFTDDVGCEKVHLEGKRKENKINVNIKKI